MPVTTGDAIQHNTPPNTSGTEAPTAQRMAGIPKPSTKREKRHSRSSKPAPKGGAGNGRPEVNESVPPHSRILSAIDGKGKQSANSLAVFEKGIRDSTDLLDEKERLIEAIIVGKNAYITVVRIEVCVMHCDVTVRLVAVVSDENSASSFDIVRLRLCASDFDEATSLIGNLLLENLRPLAKRLAWLQGKLNEAHARVSDRWLEMAG